MNGIPYYWINLKNNRAYWRPNKRMKALGFGVVALGDAGPGAEASAREWNEKWQEARSEERKPLGNRCSEPTNGFQFVYFLHVGDRVKIGTSKRPFLRQQEIVAGHAARLQRAVIVAGTQHDEYRLHKRFAAYRSGGEWFVASRPLILTMTRSAAAGTVVHDGETEQVEHQESNHSRF